MTYPETTATDALALGKTSAQIVREILDLHVIPRHPASKPEVLDMTFGTGRFWRGWSWWEAIRLTANEPFIDSDVFPKIGYPRSMMHSEDARSPQWRDGDFDLVVFDPPFTANGPGAGHNDAYGSTRGLAGAPRSIRDVHELMDMGTRQACRVARRWVLIKYQDVIESGQYHDSEYVILKAIRESGWRVHDKRWSLSGRRPQPDAQRGARLKHFRSRPSIYVLAAPVRGR